MFVLALLVHTLSTGSMHDLVMTWKADFSDSDDGMLPSQELVHACDALSIDAVSAKTLLQKNGPASLEKLAAAACLLLERNGSPRETGFWQFAFLSWAYQSGARLILDGALNALTKQLANLWRSHLETPALLNWPRISIPPLRAAIGESASGAAQLRQLMDAVSLAVGIDLPEALTGTLLRAEKVQTTRLAFGEP